MTTQPLIGPVVRSTTITIRRTVAILVVVAAIALAFAIGRVTADETSAGSAPHTTTHPAGAAGTRFDTCRFGRPC